jgi:hypothetical protein
MLMFPKILCMAHQTNALLRSLNLYKNELSFLNRARILILSVNQSVGKVKENIKLQNELAQ